MNRRTRNLLIGAATILEIAPEGYSVRRVERRGASGRFEYIRESTSRSDIESLRSDVEEIGKDFKKGKAQALHG